MRNVLISASGAGNGYALAKAIKENFPNIYLVCVDINSPELNASSVLSDKYYISPLVKDIEYKGFINNIIENENIHIYFAFLDSEFLTVEEVCREKGVVLAGVDDSEVISDKYEYFNRLSLINIPMPRFSLYKNDISWESDVYVRKKRLAFGGMDIKYGCLDKLDEGKEFFFQEYIEGEEVTVDCFYDKRNGYSRCLVRERVEVKSGVCTKARIYEDENLSIISIKIMKELRLHGGVCIQFIRSGKDWLLTDVNPRLGAGSKMCSALSNDFFSATVAYHLGESYSAYFKKICGDRFVVRQYKEILTN